MVYSILFSGRESGSPTDLMGPTRKQAVYNELLYLISELRLPPGTRLIESDLAKRFGVSKTPVREALHILERDLLVEFVPYIGATVRYMSLEEYEQLVFLVDAIEQPALRTVADNITDQELEEIWALVVQLQEAKKRQEGVLYRDLIRTIHSRLFAAMGSPHLDRVLSHIQLLSRRYDAALTHSSQEAWEAELRVATARVEHLRHRDPAGAAAAVRSGHKQLVDLLRERANEPDIRALLQTESQE